MNQIRDEDLQALAEMHADSGCTFGALSKEVRTEVERVTRSMISMRAAIGLTCYALKLAADNGHARCAEILHLWQHRKDPVTA